MKTVTEHIRGHLLDGHMLEPLGHAELADADRDVARFARFHELMNNRIRVGHVRYGATTYNREVWPRLENVLRKYKETGNTEFLVDAANYLAIEFTWPSKPGAKFEPIDRHFEPEDDLPTRPDIPSLIPPAPGDNGPRLPFA